MVTCIHGVDKDLAIIVDLKGTAAEKKNLVGGIKQVDVMERSVVKGGINALLDLVLYSQYYLSISIVILKYYTLKYRKD